MRPPRALPAAHFDRNESHVIYGTGHSYELRRQVFWSSRRPTKLPHSAPLDSRTRTITIGHAPTPLRCIPQLLRAKVQGAGRHGTGFAYQRHMTEKLSVYTEKNAFDGRILSNVQCYRFL